MGSLQVRLMLAFVLVTATGLAVVAVLLNQATEREFQSYLLHSRGMASMMDVQMPEMMQQMMGAPERTFLESVNRSLLLGGGIAVASALGLSWLLARQIASPLGRLTSAAKRIAAGQLGQRVDITAPGEIGELAQAFDHMASSLEKNERARRQLVADIAHELRTPLTVLQANLEALRDGVLEPSAERLAGLHEETELLSRLVTDLRDLSLAEVGQLTFKPQPVSLENLAERAVQKARLLAQQRRVALELEIPPGLPQVWADPDRTDQVLRNLLDNALRYTPAGGAVRVSVGSDDPSAGSARPMVVVTVADTGPGLEAEDLEQVFRRFYRVESSRARATGGSGIGLAIVKELVEAQGGRVGASSTPGRGSSFWFSLPAAPADRVARLRPGK